jgi:hypothetical protein
MTHKDFFSDPTQNAALLYLQAGNLVNAISLDLLNKLVDCASGKIEPDDEIKRHIRESARIIDILKDAADIPGCDWGVRYSPHLMMSVPHVTPCRHLASILLVHAAMCAKEKNFTQAFYHSLTAMKMGRHVTKGNIMCYVTGLRIIKDAINNFQGILPNLAKKSSAISLLKKLLSEFDNSQGLIFRNAVETELEIQNIYISNEFNVKSSQGNLRVFFSSILPKKISKLAAKKSDKFFEDNKKCFNDFKADLLDLLDLDYTQSYPQMSQLLTKISERIDDPEAALTAFWTANYPLVYNITVKLRNHIRALLIAIDIYQAKAQTRSLPDKLLPESPNDLFSGKKFKYTKTDDHFTLSCQAKDLSENKIHEYSFKV